MSLAEIKDAVSALSPDELAELGAFIRERENRAWDQQIDADFAPGGKHVAALERIDAEIDAVRLQ